MRSNWIDWFRVILMLAALAWPVRAESRDCLALERSQLVPCALRVSLATWSERIELEAAQARVLAVRQPLPGRPELSGSVARRLSSGSNPAVFNWSAALSQEFEIAGQRGARLRAAEAAVSAQGWRTQLAAQQTAEAAWLSYFEALAAQAELGLAERLEQGAGFLALAVRGRAESGLGSELDADLAEAAWLQLSQAKIQASTQLQVQTATLAVLTTGDAAAPVRLQGELEALSGLTALEQGEVLALAQRRVEFQVVQHTRRSFEERGKLYQRLRIPNLRVSAFAQNDGYGERVYGAGLAMPIPLPGLTSSYAGEIAEMAAQVRQLELEKSRLLREISLEIVTARQVYAARKQELELFSVPRLQRAERSLAELGVEIRAGRIAVRDAITLQDRLVQLLRSRLLAQRNVCLASVALARAAGMLLEGGVK